MSVVNVSTVAQLCFVYPRTFVPKDFDRINETCKLVIHPIIVHAINLYR